MSWLSRSSRLRMSYRRVSRLPTKIWETWTYKRMTRNPCERVVSISMESTSTSSQNPKRRMKSTTSRVTLIAKKPSHWISSLRFRTWFLTSNPSGSHGLKSSIRPNNLTSLRLFKKRLRLVKSSRKSKLYYNVLKSRQPTPINNTFLRIHLTSNLNLSSPANCLLRI